MSEHSRPDEYFFHSKESQVGSVRKPSGRGVAVRVDESGIKTSYVNAFKSVTGREEVMLEMGLSRVVSLPGEEGVGVGEGEKGEAKVEARVEMEHRLVVSYPTLKRIAVATAELTRAYEMVHGEIDVEGDPAKRRRG